MERGLLYQHRDILSLELRGHLPLGSVHLDFDTTDHFWFNCYPCDDEMEVLELHGDLEGPLACLYFRLICPSCGRTG